MGAAVRVILILLPFVIYFLWLRYTKKRAKAAGDSAAEVEAAQGQFVQALGLLVAFMAALFIYLALSSGEDPQKTYVPPHMENGKVVPGEFRDRDTATP
ncbi:MAG: hypothetical protein DCC73_12480 [Proteobacteria bacterium]|jgi:hypothetical protein|nr:MAG: hypothetical protein DCC73_12480 [Pseudomonadota bacterium]